MKPLAPLAVTVALAIVAQPAQAALSDADIKTLAAWVLDGAR